MPPLPEALCGVIGVSSCLIRGSGSSACENNRPWAAAGWVRPETKFPTNSGWRRLWKTPNPLFLSIRSQHLPPSPNTISHASLNLVSHFTELSQASIAKNARGICNALIRPPLAKELEQLPTFLPFLEILNFQSRHCACLWSRLCWP